MNTLRSPLTGRQEEVAALIARGQSYPQIGRALGISTRTVETMVGQIALRLPEGEGSPRHRITIFWTNRRVSRDGA